MMEHAVSMLYNSGLPPSFLLDTLDCHTQIVNRLFTPVYHRECDKYKTPYERFHGTKPSFNDMARFGCKTITFVWRDYRAKHDAHSWVGWYLGPTKCMRARRVYRPTTNKVYDGYHALFDCNEVYGDLMGVMFRSRVDAEKQQREYYNSEVKQC